MNPTNAASKTLTIRILGRDYPIACPDSERATLLHSADYLATRMDAIQRGGKVQGNERIAIMAALNITRELLDLQARQADAAKTTAPDVERRLAELQRRMDTALGIAPATDTEPSGR